MVRSELHAKRVIVAGAGHRPPRPGIGRAVALCMAEAGASVACLDLDEARARAVSDEVIKAGGTALALEVDLRDERGAAQAVESVATAFGGVDICIDIIGEARWSNFVDFTADDWDWSFNTNLRQHFVTLQAVARQMIRQRTGGALASVASVDGLASAPFHAAYGAAKAGVISLVKTLGEELAPFGIRANAVAPGAVWTPLSGEPSTDPDTPLRRPEPLDIAAALVFLCSDSARCITGQTITVDGGASTRGVFRSRYEARLGMYGFTHEQQSGG
jgi:NAD(P)-dependent dehydrogenase (short-subunit alcohol dehydrogenase family)